jgi:hypothetical protein
MAAPILSSGPQAMRECESIVVGRPEVEQVRTLAYSGTQAQMQVLFTRDGGLTAVPLEMQESLTQRAVLVGGASVGVYGDGPGFSSGGGGGSFASFRMNVQGYSYDGVARIAEDLKTRLERITRVREVRITSGGTFRAIAGRRSRSSPTARRWRATASRRCNWRRRSVARCADRWGVNWSRSAAMNCRSR